MKLEPITKLGKRNTTTSQKFDDDVVPVNYNISIIFTIDD